MTSISHIVPASPLLTLNWGIQKARVLKAFLNSNKNIGGEFQLRFPPLQ